MRWRALRSACASLSAAASLNSEIRARVIFSSIYSLYYVMGKGGEDIYEFESLAFSSCMISSSIYSLCYVMGNGGEDIYEYESLACSMLLYYQMETDCSENNFKWFACFRFSISTSISPSCVIINSDGRGNSEASPIS